MDGGRSKGRFKDQRMFSARSVSKLLQHSLSLPELVVQVKVSLGLKMPRAIMSGPSPLRGNYFIFSLLLHNYHFVIYLLKKLQEHNTILFTIINMLYIRPPEIIHLMQLKLCTLWPPSSHFPFPAVPENSKRCQERGQASRWDGEGHIWTFQWILIRILKRDFKKFS